MRGTHEHRMDQVFMGGPNKSGHDGEGGTRGARNYPSKKCFSSSPRMDCMWV